MRLVFAADKHNLLWEDVLGIQTVDDPELRLRHAVGDGSLLRGHHVFNLHGNKAFWWLYSLPVLVVLVLLLLLLL